MSVKTIGLRESIILTLGYFDIFEYPLTSWEVWKFLYKNNAGYLEVIEALQSLEKEEKIIFSNGFFQLPGKNNARSRLKKYNDAEKKYNFALRALKLINWIPWIRLAAVCNNLSYSNAKPDSDIDFFIVVGKGRLWTARFLTAITLHLSRLRRHGKKISNRICLSFFVSTTAFDFKNILIEEDIYFYYWLCTLFPLCDSFEVFSALQKENFWLKEFVPNSFFVKAAERRSLAEPKFIYKIKMFLEKIFLGKAGDIFEKIIRKIQMSKMMKNKASSFYLNNKSVIINDSMLKFHENDRREFYKKEWLKRFENNTLPSFAFIEKEPQKTA